MDKSISDLKAIIAVLSQERLDPEQMRPIARLAMVEKVKEEGLGQWRVSFKPATSFDADGVIRMMEPNKPEIAEVPLPPLGANYAGIPVTLTYAYRIGTVELAFGFSEANNHRLVQILRKGDYSYRR